MGWNVYFLGAEESKKRQKGLMLCFFILCSAISEHQLPICKNPSSDLAQGKKPEEASSQNSVNICPHNKTPHFCCKEVQCKNSNNLRWKGTWRSWEGKLVQHLPTPYLDLVHFLSPTFMDTKLNKHSVRKDPYYNLLYAKMYCHLKNILLLTKTLSIFPNY